MKTVAVVLSLTLIGCASTQEIARPNGVKEILVQCGTGTGWGVCYSKANEVCPNGYTTLGQTASYFSGKELRISCGSSVASRLQ